MRLQEIQFNEIKEIIRSAINQEPARNHWRVYLGKDLNEANRRTITDLLGAGGFEVEIECRPDGLERNYWITIQGPNPGLLENSRDHFIASIYKIFETDIERIKENIRTAIKDSPCSDSWRININKNLHDGYVKQNITNLLKYGNFNFEIINYAGCQWDNASFTIQINAPAPSSTKFQEPFVANIYEIFKTEIERIKQKIIMEIRRSSFKKVWKIDFDRYLGGYVRGYITNLLKDGDFNFEFENHPRTCQWDDDEFILNIYAPAPSNNYQGEDPFIRSIYDYLKSDQKRTTTTNVRPNEPFPNIQVNAFQNINVPKDAHLNLGNKTVSAITIAPPKYEPNTQERIVTANYKSLLANDQVRTNQNTVIHTPTVSRPVQQLPNAATYRLEVERNPNSNVGSTLKQSFVLQPSTSPSTTTLNVTRPNNVTERENRTIPNSHNMQNVITVSNSSAKIQLMHPPSIIRTDNAASSNQAVRNLAGEASSSQAASHKPNSPQTTSTYEFNKFVAMYNENYHSKWLKNPFSKMKWLLFFGRQGFELGVRDMTGVRDYARTHPNSRTNKVLGNLDNERSTKASVLAAPTQIQPPVAAPKQIANEIPEDFCCPITYEVMENPVLCTLDGRSYEDTAIRDWLTTKNRTSPITRAAMNPDDTVDNVLKPNITLKNTITAFKDRNPSLFVEEKPLAPCSYIN
jgi:U-box domain